MSQKEFVLKMIIAYTTAHGYTPSQGHIQEWLNLYREI